MSDKDTLGNKSSERSDLAEARKEAAYWNARIADGSFPHARTGVNVKAMEIMVDHVFALVAGVERLEEDIDTLRARVKELEGKLSGRIPA